MDLPAAGPAAGPCLFKDGQFLVSHIPYTDLIRTSFTINEGFTNWIVDIIEEITYVSQARRVGILGMAFKANNDDTRYSLSFKLKKILEAKGFEIVEYDPLVNSGSLPHKIPQCEVVVVMAPHDVFDGEFYSSFINVGTVIIDIWRHFPESKLHKNGVYVKFESEDKG